MRTVNCGGQKRLLTSRRFTTRTPPAGTHMLTCASCTVRPIIRDWPPRLSLSSIDYCRVPELNSTGKLAFMLANCTDQYASLDFTKPYSTSDLQHCEIREGLPSSIGHSCSQLTDQLTTQLTIVSLPLPRAGLQQRQLVRCPKVVASAAGWRESSHVWACCHDSPRASSQEHPWPS